MISLLIFLITAQTNSAWQIRHCHYGAANKLGLKEGLAGKEINKDLFEKCKSRDPDGEVESGYMRGYRQGMLDYKAEHKEKMTDEQERKIKASKKSGSTDSKEKDKLDKYVVEGEGKTKPTVSRDQVNPTYVGSCNYNAAYRYGYDEGLSGRSAITGRLFRHCSKEERGALISSFKKGYKLGSKEYEAKTKKDTEVKQQLVEGQSYMTTCKIKTRFVEGYVQNLTKYSLELYGDMQIRVYDRQGNITRDEKMWQYSEIPAKKKTQVIYLRKDPGETRCEIDVSEALFVPQYDFRKK